MDLVQFVQSEFVEKKDLPEFGAGDTITVYTQIKEGDKPVRSFSAAWYYSAEAQVLLKHLPSAK